MGGGGGLYTGFYSTIYVSVGKLFHFVARAYW